jgi:hypothetical protein
MHVLPRPLKAIPEGRESPGTRPWGPDRDVMSILRLAPDPELSIAFGERSEDNPDSTKRIDPVQISP